MDNVQTLQRYFSQLPKRGKPTAQDIRDAVAATGTEAITPVLETVLLHAAARFGIDPEKELSDLFAKVAAGKAAATEQKRRDDIKARAGHLGESLTKLAADIDQAAPDAIAAALASIGTEAAGLTTTAATVNRFPTWADYEAAWQKDNDSDFSPELFDRLPFPEGTVSYIGARTGRGKTTAMVNIGIEALFPIQWKNNKIKPRRVLFVSLEESQKQILRRFSLCLAYRKAPPGIRADLLQVTNPYTQKKDPKNAYKNWKRGREVGGDGAAVFVEAIIEADKKIKATIEAGDLLFMDGIGAPLAEILAAIRAMGKGDIVLLDYIQKIPAAGNTYSGNPDLERIRDGSQRLIEAAKGAECIIIAGAQFNRESVQGGQRADDEFTDADFRGCGDLEQDAHNAIGIGRNKERTKHYYGIIKSREGETTDKLFTLDFAGGYSFMDYQGDEFTPVKPKGRGDGGGTKAKEGKKRKVYNDDGSFQEVEFTGGEVL